MTTMVLKIFFFRNLSHFQPSSNHPWVKGIQIFLIKNPQSADMITLLKHIYRGIVVKVSNVVVGLLTIDFEIDICYFLVKRIDTK